MVGMPDMANVCLAKLVEAGFDVIGLVPPHKNNPSYYNMVQCANVLNVPVYPFENSPNEGEFVQKIAKFEADIGVICSYDIKLSRDFLKTTAEGYINCHPSILPKYRGANPYHHIIKNGETITGVSLHFADENFDTGDVIVQKEISLEPKETMGTLFNRSNFLIADCLIDVLKNYQISNEIPSKKQKNGEFPTAPKITNNIIIDFNNNVEQIERLIRASNPFYNVILFFRGIMFRIIAADFKIGHHNFVYGEFTKTLDELEIAVKGGFLIPKIIQVGTWGIFETPDFIEKFGPQIGERLTDG